MPNITQWASAGLYAVQVAQRGSTGHMAGWAGLEAADTDTESSMRLLIGGVTAPSPLPQATRVRNRGRDTFIAEHVFDAPPNDFNIVFEDFDGDVSALINTLTVFTLGEWDIVPEGGPTTFQAMYWLFTRHAISKETATDGTAGFENLLVLNSSGRVEPGTMDFQAPGTFTIVATASPVTETPYGTTALASHGQQTIVTERWFSEYPCSMTCFVGDNSEVDVGLGFTPISTDKTKAYNVDTGAALTVSSVNTSTDEAVLSAAPASGALCLVVYETTDI